MYNVLLVDDEERTIDMLEETVDWLELGVDKTYKAGSMVKAITSIRENKIDILICDIEMPNGTGLELLAWLRENGFEKLPCIFLTCHPEFDYMRKAIQLQSYDYILQPINYQEFERVLKNLIKILEEGVEQETSKIPADGDRRNIEEEVKRYIKNHIQDNIAIQDIADELHFNPKYLMRVFKSQTGMGILECITDTRMHKAKMLLKTTSLPVKEIASQVGYTDYAYFTRVFGKEFGISPKEYRNS